MAFGIGVESCNTHCFFFFSPCSSDVENGTSERRKPGKSPPVSLQTPTSEVEHFDDGKKVDFAR